MIKEYHVFYEGLCIAILSSKSAAERYVLAAGIRARSEIQEIWTMFNCPF